MANNRTITSANAVLILSCDQFGASRIQGFGVDALAETDAIARTETQQGIDGRLSGGYVPAPVPFRFTLMADSESNDYMDNIIGLIDQTRETVILTGSLVLSSIRSKYAMRRGFLVNYPKMPSATRTLQPRQFTINWEDVTRSAT